MDWRQWEQLTWWAHSAMWASGGIAVALLFPIAFSRSGKRTTRIEVAFGVCVVLFVVFATALVYCGAMSGRAARAGL